MEIICSVRNLVEFILRGGDIDNRRSAVPVKAMQEGGRIHRMLQKQMGADYHAEVGLSYRYETDHYVVVIEGRADGIIIPLTYAGENRDKGLLAGEVRKLPSSILTMDQVVTIDEIKGTYKDISKMREPAPVHLAQAQCYAFIYGVQNHLHDIRIRMTYCNMNTEEVKYFHLDYTLEELRIWFFDVMERYRKWTDYEYTWRKIRTRSIKEMAFPFSYRDGQKELATYVYQTIYHKRKLFIEAPTGVGKTLSTVFPAIKAIGEEKGEKLFYLTAKTMTRTAAEETFELLRGEGLSFKTVVLTARDKICFMEEAECNPDLCPYAKGHYDRVNDAMYALLTASDKFTRKRIEEYAEQFRVCPFELCLDMSLFADGIICDYNYLFDPHVYLKRFFSEGVRGDYLFLIDEAHNLVDRGREMYSAVLRKETFLQMKKSIKVYDAYLAKLLERCNKELLAMKRACETVAGEGYMTVVEGCNTDALIGAFQRVLSRLAAAMDQYLEEHETSPVKKELLEFYFEVSHFLSIYELLDEHYMSYSQVEAEGGFLVRLFCVDPSVNLRACMMRGRSTILFSATLLPIGYYKSLLGGVEGDYDVYARSVFQPDKRGLFIADDVTSRYTRRSETEYFNIAHYIHEIVRNRRGNYLIFFPSYQFLNRVYEQFKEHYWKEDVECVLQGERMSELDRELFLDRFRSVGQEEIENVLCMKAKEASRSLLGFCVSGGIFSEGIDLKNDSLIGAVIVGTGLPQICPEREIVRRYFDERKENGYDYAYKFPGMNKILQAAGRVIRTQNDIGIVVLLDERFLHPTYRKLFPREWKNYEKVSIEQIAERIERFWSNWL